MDIKETQDQIRALEELTRKTVASIENEKRLNQTILYNTRNRKKYTDALSASNTAYQDLINREKELASSIKSTQTSINQASKSYKKLKNEEDQLKESKKELEKQNKKGTDEYKKLEKEHKKVRNSMSDNLKEIKNLRSELKSYNKDVKDIKIGTDDLRKSFEDIEKLNLSNVKDINKYAEERVKIMEKQYDIWVKKKTITQEEGKALKEQLKTVESISEIKGDELKKRVSKEDQPMAEKVIKGAKEAGSLEESGKKEALSIRAGQFKSLKGAFSPKASFSSIISSSKSFGEGSKNMKSLGNVMGNVGKDTLKVTKLMGSLGTVLKGIGMIGWIGIALKAVMMLGKAVNNLDKFLKGFNQTFAKLHGPTIMMQNIDKEMDAFTDSIFNLQRNLKLGLKSEEIVGMFHAVAESGMSLQGILNKVSGGYNELIERSAKVSLDFGVSMEEAGGMLGEMMTDLRYSVEEASDSFKVLAYDASVAGIQSQRFYQAAYAAAESLSYYGKFVNAASGALKKFQEQGAMGFKDAQKQATTMMNMFKDMDSNQRMIFINLMGGVDALRTHFVDRVKELGEDIKSREEKIAEYRMKLSGYVTQDERTNLEQRIKAEEEAIKISRKNQQKANRGAMGDIREMSIQIPVLSGKASKLMGDMLKSVKAQSGIDLTKDAFGAMEYLTKSMNLSKEFSESIMDTLMMTSGYAKDAVKELGKILPKDEKSGLKKQIFDIVSSEIKDNRIDMDMIRTNLEEYTSLTEDEVDKLMKQLDVVPKTVLKYLKEGEEGVTQKFDDLVISEMETMEHVTGETGKEQEKRLDDLIKNTHTIEDFIGINKENAKYFLAGNDIQKGAAMAAIQTARNTGTILDFVKDIRDGGKKRARTEEDFRQSGDYKKLEDLMVKEKVLRYKISTATGKKKDKLTKDLEETVAKQKKVAGANIIQAPELEAKATQRSKEKIMSVFDKSTKSDKYFRALNVLTRLNLTKQRLKETRDIGEKKELKEEIKDLINERDETAGKATYQGAEIKKAASSKAKDTLTAYKKLVESYKGLESQINSSDIETKGKATREIGKKIAAYNEKYGLVRSAKLEDLRAEKDYRAITGGYALLSKGDVVVNARNMSTGIGGDLGAFSSDLTKTIGMVGKGYGTAAPTIPVQISIGSINGDAEDFLKRIKPAMEQAFERMYFDKQKRK